MGSPFLERLQLFLESRGRRLTAEKKVLAAIVETIEQPFNPEGVITVSAGHHGIRRVSRSTVYRLFRDLDEAGLIRNVHGFRDTRRFFG